jgi:hypothetical protein
LDGEVPPDTLSTSIPVPVRRIGTGAAEVGKKETGI